MSNFEVQEPILNSPYEEPQEYWRIEEGEPPERVDGRRSAMYFYRPPGPVSSGEGAGTAIEFALKLVEELYGKQKAEEVGLAMVVP